MNRPGTLVAVLLALLASSCRRGAHAAPGRQTSVVPDSGVVPVAAARGLQGPRGPLVGDTLDLYSVGGLALPWQDLRSRPCDAAEPPAFERLVFLDDSTYGGTRAMRPGCRDPRVSSQDTIGWASLYRIHGDTLTLFVGDGNEVEESYNGRVFPDSVVQFDVEGSRLARYMRRRAAGHSAPGATREVRTFPSPEEWDSANAAIVRLPPAAFHQLPAAVRADLERRGCLIPQNYTDTHPHNVVHGQFARPGQTDWAVLCSRNDTSTILVFWRGAADSVAELAKAADRNYLQGMPEGIVYSRGLGVADTTDIRRLYSSYGGPEPPPLDHDGIDDGFEGKASEVHYWYRDHWIELTGAD